MEFLAKTSVSVKMLTGWSSWVITLPEPTSVLRADKRKFFEVCHDFLGKRYGFDIVGAATSMDETTPHMHTNHSSHL